MTFISRFTNHGVFQSAICRKTVHLPTRQVALARVWKYDARLGIRQAARLRGECEVGARGVKGNHGSGGKPITDPVLGIMAPAQK